MDDRHSLAREIYITVFELIDTQSNASGDTASKVATIAEMACRLAVSDGDNEDLGVLMSNLSDIIVSTTK